MTENAVEAARKPAGYLATLRNRAFATIWAGQAVSLFGDALYRMTLIWLVQEITGSALATSMVMMFSLLPVVVFGLFSGALVDMLDRKRIMIWADLLRAGVVMVVPLLLWSGGLEYWHLCAVSLAHGFLSTFFGPALNASIPRIVGREHLLSANALSSLTQQAAGIAGPALGGVLVGLAGTGPAFLIDAASFVVSALAIASVSLPGPRAGEAEIQDLAAGKPGWREMRISIAGGFSFVWKRPLLLSIVTVGIVLNFLGAPSAVLAALHVKIWDGGATAYGTICAALSLGMFCSTLAINGIVARAGRTRTFLVGLLLSCLGTAGFALAGSLPLGTTAYLLVGVSNSMLNIPFLTWLQESVPDHMRGRIFSVLGVSLSVAQPAGLGLAGYAADLFGTRAIFLFSSFVTGIAALVFVRIFARYGGLDATARVDDKEIEMAEYAI